MHENREISCTSWSTDQHRSAKAINRTADTNVREKSDRAALPVNQPNNEGQPSAEVGEVRAQTQENIGQSRMRPTQSRELIGSCARLGQRIAETEAKVSLTLASRFSVVCRVRRMLYSCRQLKSEKARQPWTILLI